MNEKEIIQYAINNIQKGGPINVEWKELNNDNAIDGKLFLNLNKHNIALYAEIKKELRNIHLAKIEELAITKNPFIIVAQRIFPKIKEELRKRNIAYLEANGNIFLNNDEIYLYIDGNTPIELKNKTTNRAFTKTGLKVIYQFLIKDCINNTYREIAELTDTGIGTLNTIFNGLKEEGFLIQLTKNELQMENKKKLLDKWVMEYEKRLKPTLAIGTFRFLNKDDFYNWKDIPLKKGKTIWGGEPAGDLLTNYLRPEEFTLYTNEETSALMKNYRLVPDLEGNIKVFKQFWINEQENTNTVHPLLAYADLMNKGDRRCTETAQKIFDEYLQDQF
ncbi:type IV toxin-antitoxin system AbiEi family antitoxin [Flavobacterium maritimum]|uniref:type IV toxin-antitoxin system AbiEi family antitoxin n=1 Tax=Flavobacterium maritimum TaxID=3149042 RepID=UPI0032B35EFB